MNKTINIYYPPKLLEQEKPLIRDSVRKALENLFQTNYLKSHGLNHDDPPPLVQWRLKQAPWAKETEYSATPRKARSVQHIFPIDEVKQITARRKTAVDYLRKLTLRSVVEQLTRMAESDEQLENWLRRLIAPFGKKDTRFEETRREQQFLIKNWIAEDDHPQFFKASLCFYSGLALAQTLHFYMWKKALPLDRRKSAASNAAKTAERLGLRTAELTIFRERPSKCGCIYWEAFQERLA